MRIIYVCTGNICRSAFAEHTSRQLLAQAGVQGVRVSSMGTAGGSGGSQDPIAHRIALEWGVDMSSHQARSLQPQELMGADVILAMDKGHLDFLHASVVGVQDRTALFLKYPKSSWWGPSQVVDPYRLSEDTYRKVFKQIWERLPKTLGL